MIIDLKYWPLKYRGNRRAGIAFVRLVLRLDFPNTSCAWFSSPGFALVCVELAVLLVCFRFSFQDVELKFRNREVVWSRKEVGSSRFGALVGVF